MKQDDLQHSEKLASYFAPRREEASLLSTEDVEKLLAGRAMLPNPSRITVRKIIMTLTGMAGLAAIGYLALFNNATDMSHKTYPSYKEPAQNISQQHEATIITADSTKPGKAHVEQIEPNQADHKPRWSAPANQVYADLSPSELSRLGIFVSGDTIFSYKRNEKDSVERSFLYVHPINSQVKGHGIGGGGVVTVVPSGVHAPTFYPVLMTYSNGNGAAYRIEEGGRREVVMIGEDNTMKAFRDWLMKPGTPGYYALGFTRVMEFRDATKQQRDSATLSIGKDLPQPPFMPLMTPDIDYSDTVKQELMALAHYYDGSNPIKPNFTLPKTLALTVDTVTAKDLLEMMDHSENTSAEQHMHSIMARLNELVPVIVRMHGGSGAPKDDDFIFWYEPSEELFAALPQSQARVFRKYVKPPQCMNAPQAVTTSAEVTYCVSEPQEVNVAVIDLTGHVVMETTQHAESGDNIAKISTASLPSGMYLIVVQDKDGSQRTRRIWVQNAHPQG